MEAMQGQVWQHNVSKNIHAMQNRQCSGRCHVIVWVALEGDAVLTFGVALPAAAAPSATMTAPLLAPAP